jgi:predicted metalloprotease with PDZ domain
MTHSLFAALILLSPVPVRPGRLPKPPLIAYTLRVDPADLSGFDVEMRLRHIPDTFRLAMAAHPEYDDRYWRYLDGPRAETPAGAGTVTRLDSALWLVVARGGEATVRYRLRLPPAPEGPRSAWKPFLEPTGGLVGGPHSFLYVVGATAARAHVTLELPAGWEAATALEPTADSRVFSAPSAEVLIDSPIMVGRLRTWRFAAGGVPHRVVYWPGPGAAAFDTAAFVDGIARVARQAIAIFGGAPYREYTFLFEDGAYGALEHVSSVTIGAPSTDLARDPNSALGETAHEFFHTWNLMRIRPAEYRDLDWRTQPPVAGLWFSEGLSVFYADLLRRRAGLPAFDSTRVAHLERLIASYLFNTGNARFSAESVSRIAYNARPGSLGDYNASTHLQGELIGTLLDLTIRDATSNTRSLDDVMRTMLARFSGKSGFTGADVERAVTDVCHCAVGDIFSGYVRGAHAMDFDRYLRLAGVRMRVTSAPSLDRDGRPVPDLRIFAWDPPGETNPRLIITDPASVWARAGLHTGDPLLALNGTPVPNWPAARAVLRAVRVGDTVQVEVRHGADPWRTTVVAAGYDRPVVTIEPIPQATDRQRALRARWLTGAP